MKPHNVTWPIYLRNGFGYRIARLGERFRLSFLIYNPLVMRAFHDEGIRNAPKVVAAVCSRFPIARRFLDVGAGSGVFSKELNRIGAHAIAVEKSQHGIRMARKQGVDCRTFDLTRTPPADVPECFDLVYSFEVAEHLPPSLGDRLVDFMTSFRADVVFTAAQPGQGGTGHINEQPRDYWIERFTNREFCYDQALAQALSKDFDTLGAASWFARNVSVFHPKPGVSVLHS